LTTTVKSNIESFKYELIDEIEQYRAKGVIDVIYLSDDDVEDDLSDKYDELLESDEIVKKAGVVFLQKDSNKLLDIIIFDKYENTDILNSISLQVGDLIEGISNLQKYNLKYDDILPYIPHEIKVPELPPIKELIKDEFETLNQFETRVENSVKDREESIKNLQREYSTDIYNRNLYIESLQNAYKLYLKESMESKNSFIAEINNNIPQLLKLLFLENISAYTADYFYYNAEINKLYFQIKSVAKNFSQDVVATIPAEEARMIKEERKFKIQPIINSSKDEIILSGFKIVNLDSNNEYETSYTDIDFKPQEIKVQRYTHNEVINQEVNTYFKQQKQEDKLIIDTSKKEIWYIDIVNTLNAKVPNWFSQPNLQDTVLGYGSGKSLEKAKINAKKDLALMIRTQISVSTVVSTSSNNFKTFSEVKSSIKEQSNVRLNSSNYSVVKQEYIDGNWYVAMEYNLEI